MSFASILGVPRPVSMRPSPVALPLSTVLRQRTACGVVFDRLHEAERQWDQETVLGRLEWRCVGHHDEPGALAPWSVVWSNGTHHIAVTLLPGPGAWAVAQSYFDRAPPTLAWLFASQVLAPWWAERTDGPWVASPVGSSQRYLPGGAHAFAGIAWRGLSFEFDLAFASPAAATWFVRTQGVLNTARDHTVDFSLPCAVRVGRLRLGRQRVERLRLGDVLLIGPTMGTAAERDPDFDGSTFLSPLEDVGAHAWLCVGMRNRPVALLERDALAWRLGAFATFISSEQPMDDFPSFDLDVSPLEHALAPLELSVDIVVSTLTMRVAELQALRVGDVIALDHAVDESKVEVRVSGQTCARGVLIAFEGRLAVQLSELVPGSGAKLSS